jgi:CelD/BcsL family acetyltransferase involved in cellulose biosynthesis
MTAVHLPAAVERVTVEEAARRAPASGSVFASWEWLGPWLEHLGGPDPLLYAVGDVAVFGFVEHGGVLRLIGDGPSDECGPICAPEHREAAARAMAETARGRALIARDLPGDGDWARWLGGEVTHVEPCPSVEAPDFGAWLAAKPASFRRKARVVERRLEAAGASMRSASEATVREDFATLVQLHRARFGGRTRLFDGAFLADAVPRLLRAGRLRLRTLELAGEPVAAMMFLRHRGAEAYYQAGWDPRATALSPGFALLLDTVREHGELSLLRGAEPYKLAWASGDRPLVTVSVRAR